MSCIANLLRTVANWFDPPGFSTKEAYVKLDAEIYKLMALLQPGTKLERIDDQVVNVGRSMKRLAKAIGVDP